MNADRNEVNDKAGLCFPCAPKFASFPAKITENKCLNESLYIRKEKEQFPESNLEKATMNKMKRNESCCSVVRPIIGQSCCLDTGSNPVGSTISFQEQIK